MYITLRMIGSTGSALFLGGCCSLFGINCPEPVQQSSIERLFDSCFSSAQLPPQAMLVYTGPVNYDTGDLWLHLPPSPPDRRESFSKLISPDLASSLRTRLDENKGVKCVIDTSSSLGVGANLTASAAMIPVTGGGGLDFSKGRIVKISVEKAWLDEIDRGSGFSEAWKTAFNPGHSVSIDVSAGKYKAASFAMRVKGYRVEYKGSDISKLAANGTYTENEIGNLKGEVKWEKKADDVIEYYVEGPTNIAFILRPLSEGFSVQSGAPDGTPVPPAFVIPASRGLSE